VAEVLGDLHYVPASYATTVGFDAIAVALLGRANPVGILLSGLLFGAMQTGSGPMQVEAHVYPQIVSVLQAIILFFLTAEVLVRTIFRVRAETRGADEPLLAASYGRKT
jgi:simple sugar transport system permease protein